MQVTIRKTRDTITPDLLRRLKAISNPRPALEAMGLVVEAMAKRAFDEPGLRPASWQGLSAATLKAKARKNLSAAILRANGVLWRSIRLTQVSSRSVTIGSDRPYAAFHQLGTKHIPARPFFPFTKSGQLTEKAKTRVESALRKALDTGK